MEKVGIAKLTGENYDSWKLDVEFLLVKEKLWKYVSPGVKPKLHQEKSNAAELATWDEGDQQARATIGLLMTKGQHGLIRNTTTAKQVWDNVKKKFEKKTLSTKAYLIKRICDLRYNDGGNIEEHLQEFEDLFDRLEGVGYKFEEELQVIFILRSLPSSFSALSTALENRSENELTVDIIKGSIINEVEKQSEMTSSDATVLKVAAKHSVQCNHCHKFGHKWRQCKQLTKRYGEGSSQSDDDDIIEKSSVKFQHKAEASDDEFAFGVNEGSAGQWIVDSGATTHVCTDQNAFESLEPLRGDTPKTVTVADGKSAKVKGVGTCRLRCYGQGDTERNVTLSNVLFVPDLNTNLVSVARLVDKGATVTFDKQKCTITSGNRTAAVAPRNKGVFFLRMVKHKEAETEWRSRNAGGLKKQRDKLPAKEERQIYDYKAATVSERLLTAVADTSNCSDLEICL